MTIYLPIDVANAAKAVADDQPDTAPNRDGWTPPTGASGPRFSAGDSYSAPPQPMFDPGTPDTMPNAQPWTPEPTPAPRFAFQQPSYDEGYQPGTGNVASAAGDNGKTPLQNIAGFGGSLVGWDTLPNALRPDSGASFDEQRKANSKVIMDALMQAGVPGGLKMMGEGAVLPEGVSLMHGGPGGEVPRTGGEPVPPEPPAPRAPEPFRSPDVAPPPPAVPGTPPDVAMSALRDALDAEVRLRESGTVANEISAGRGRQAARISGNLNTAEMANATLDERIAAARSGAKTGQLRETFQQPLEIAPEHVDALGAHLQGVLEPDGPFTTLNGLQALNSLVKGENVQPAQLKLLQRVFGDDIAGLASQANLNRASPRATLTSEAESRIANAGRFEEKQIATYEERAQAQQAHADDLASKLAMNPTNSRLKRTVDQAREAGLYAQNKADEMLVKRTQSLTPVAEGAPASEILAQQKATYGRVNTLREAETAAQAGTATEDQRLLLQAKDLMGRKVAVSPSMEQAQLASVDYWLKGNRAILDAIGETTHEKMRSIAATMSGNLADSWLTTLYQRKALIEGALTQQGWADGLARKASQSLVDAELAQRYPNGIPARIAAEIEKTKIPFGGGNTVLQGAANLSQSWKNLAFGPADVGVFGQQVLHAVETSPTNILAGVVNRALNVLHMGLDTRLVDDIALSKRLQYQLDGVPQGITTGITQDANKGLLHYLGVGKYNVGNFVDASSNFQFGTVLGGLRNLNYEGNLVALHLAGQDISSPAVRATAAGMANSATSYAPAALNANRALAERAALMTPSMRRAQVTSILQLGRVFTPGATASERILGSIAIANIAGSTLAIGKLLNDRIGVTDFEFDPSKPGFGQIVSKVVTQSGQHVVYSLFPQEQVVATIAKSVRELAANDPKTAALEWAKLLMGSSSPALQGVEKAAGYGYEPGNGYKFGDLKGGLLNIAPLPPIFQSYITGQLSNEQIPSEIAGLNSFLESPSGAAKRGEFGNLSGVPQQQAIPAEAWKTMGEQDFFKGELAGYNNYGAWYTDTVSNLANQMKDAGLPTAEAINEAEKAVASHPVAKAYIELRNVLEDQWTANNTDERQKQWDAEMQKPSYDRQNLPRKTERDIILSKPR